MPDTTITNMNPKSKRTKAKAGSTSTPPRPQFRRGAVSCQTAAEYESLEPRMNREDKLVEYKEKEKTGGRGEGDPGMINR